MALPNRFPELASAPRVRLAELPTRVERLSHVSADLRAEVWCMRDDATAPRYGGNKVRKLEWLLGDAKAKDCDTLITTGALGSHHVLATCIYGRASGFDVHAVLFPQSMSGHVEENLRADLATGAHLHAGRSYASIAAQMLALTGRLRLSGHRPYVIGPGGSSPVGSIGYVVAGLELAQHIEANHCPEPSTVYVAAGSGGTVVGLALGLAAAGLHTRVVGVRVADRIAINRPVLSHLARTTVRRLRSIEPLFPDVAQRAMGQLHIDHGQIGAGYGSPTDAGHDATSLAAQDGIVLDPTYTAKAFAHVSEHAGRRDHQPVIYLHTLSSAPMAPLVKRAPPLPEWAMRHAARAR